MKGCGKRVLMALIIDGKKLSLEIRDEIREETGKLKEKEIETSLAVVLVGNDPGIGLLQYEVVVHLGGQLLFIADPVDHTRDLLDRLPDALLNGVS